MYTVISETDPKRIDVDQLVKMSRYNNIVAYKSGKGVKILRRIQTRLTKTTYGFIDLNSSTAPPTYEGEFISKSICKAFSAKQQLYLFSGLQELMEFMYNQKSI